MLDILYLFDFIELFCFVETGGDQLLDGVHDGGGIFAFTDHPDGLALGGFEHQQTHHRIGAGFLVTAADCDGGAVAGGELYQFDGGAGVQRPDQGGTNQPGQTKTDPASGGEGAAGAGGSKGFGT